MADALKMDSPRRPRSPGVAIGVTGRILKNSTGSWGDFWGKLILKMVSRKLEAATQPSQRDIAKINGESP